MSDFIIWTWTLRQVPKCSRPSAAHLISHRTGTRCYGCVVLTFSIAFLTQCSFPLQGTEVTVVTENSPWARKLLFIYCLLIVLIKMLNVYIYYISIFILLQFLTLIVLCS